MGRRCSLKPAAKLKLPSPEPVLSEVEGSREGSLQGVCHARFSALGFAEEIIQYLVLTSNRLIAGVNLLLPRLIKRDYIERLRWTSFLIHSG